MDSLKELIGLIGPNKLKRIELLDLHQKPSSNINRLYQAINKGEVNTAQEAKDLLYTETPSSGAFTNLKASLRKRLLNTLFFIDVNKRSFTDRQAAYFTLYKELAAAKLLVGKGANDTAMSLMEKMLKPAIKFEFTDIVIDASRLLRLQYATRKINKKKYLYNLNLNKKYYEIDYWENKAEQLYGELIFRYENNKTSQEDLQLLANKYYTELETGISIVNTYKFRFYTALIRYICYSCRNDYVSIIPIAEETILFFKAKPYQAYTAIQISLHHQLVGYLQLGDYERGLDTGRRSQALLERGAFNWFKNLEYLLILAMHTERYQDAYEHYQEAIQESRFKSLPASIKEIWDIYRANIHFLVKQDLIQPNQKDKSFSSFRINKFLNDKPHFFKDKKGMNVAILIVQILFYLQNNQHRQAIDRIEAIEKYAKRHLYTSDTLRAYFIIRLLLTLPRASFEKKRVLTLAQRPLEKLNATANLRSNPVHKMEIIRYEKIWEMALDILPD